MIQKIEINSDFTEKNKDKFYEHVRLNNSKKVKSYLMNGMNPDACNTYGNAPLFVATKNYEVFKLLVEAGANTKITNKAGNLLHIASYELDCEVIKYIVENLNFNINEVSPNGNTALFNVLFSFNKIDSSLTLAKWMIEKGADIHKSISLFKEKKFKQPNAQELIEFQKSIEEKKLLQERLEIKINHSLKNQKMKL